jgi:cell division control protein 6
MPGRDSEIKKLKSVLSSFLEDDNGNTASDKFSIFISGTPGTGKTALVHSVLHSYRLESRRVKLIDINCMAFANIDALWEKLERELADYQQGSSSKRTKKKDAKSAVETLLCRLDQKW